MRRIAVAPIAGIGLIVVGALFLLQTLGIVEGVLPLLWMLVFVAGGAIFLYFFWIHRDHWWALIPGFTLIGIGILLALTEYGPREWENLAAALLVGSIGLSFWMIYLVNREHWWAIIPGGVLFTVAAIVGLEDIVAGDDLIVSIFFLGIALTFGAIALMPTPYGRMKWAWIPAGVLFVVGIILFSVAVSGFKYVWPVAIIVIGLYILYRTLLGKGKVRGEIEEP